MKLKDTFYCPNCKGLSDDCQEAIESKDFGCELCGVAICEYEKQCGSCQFKYN